MTLLINSNISSLNAQRQFNNISNQNSDVILRVSSGSRINSAKRRYLTQAVFPVYILHQTLIVVMAHALKPAHMPPLREGAILVVMTLAISFGAFEIVRRAPLLRPLFGIGRMDGDMPAPVSALPQAHTAAA